MFPEERGQERISHIWRPDRGASVPPRTLAIGSELPSLPPALDRTFEASDHKNDVTKATRSQQQLG